MSEIAYFRGQYVPIAEANVNIKTHAFLYGTSIFEGIRGYWNPDSQCTVLFRAKEHFVRMLESARILMLENRLSVDEHLDICKELVSRNNCRQDVYLQPRLYKSGTVIPPKLHGVESDYCCFLQAFGDYVDTKSGLKACVTSWRRISDNAIPPRGKIGGAYVNTGLAMAEAHMNGFHDAIFLTGEGNVSEGSGMNLFLVKHGKLITSRRSDDILEGITRDSIIQLARNELKLEVDERAIDRSELYTVDEVFFTGTAAQVAPVVSIDHRPIGTGEVGPVTMKMQALYMDVAKGKVPAYDHWLLKVPARA